MSNLTAEQLAAVESRGKVIVSASAGSGKTFVMIEKLVKAIAEGADLDDVLAVTFTKKAAAQMKEKLRTALIKRIDGADGETKARLKVQLSKISAANISTIHSFCARLIRTYFYLLGVDSGFDIISSDDAAAKDLKAKAFDALFDRLYSDNDGDFKHLLNCFMKKRSDASLKKLLNEAYSDIRSVARYEEILEKSQNLYTEEGFNKICAEYAKAVAPEYEKLLAAVKKYREGFLTVKNAKTYSAIFDEMEAALKLSAASGIFDEKPPFTVTRKPSDPPEDKQAGEQFKNFKDCVQKKYNACRKDFKSRERELELFLKSGVTAKAFCKVLLQFDREYAALLRDENKLDYNDLEHMTLRLLQDETVKSEINSKYKYVFVDEYQDVNPVQEEIISGLGGCVFLVGDVKQAIYGFRGSKSLFFAEKYSCFLGGDGTALKLSNNFRSADGVLNFVNALFADIMKPSVCGINYAESGVMLPGGGYPHNCGGAEINVFGKDAAEDRELTVYSVKNDGRETRYTREGLAVLAIVEKELQSTHYDLKSGAYVRTQPEDICILTRKNKGGSAEGIVKALRAEGYSVSGAQTDNVCETPEVKNFLDILSLIDNAEQDMPFVTALLSPIGNFTENELAHIRIAIKDSSLKNGKNELSFRECCKLYCNRIPGEISQKLNIFLGKLQKLRALSEIACVGEVADELLETYGLEAAIGAAGADKIKNVLKLIAEGAELSLSAFLNKIKSGGYDVKAPAQSSPQSIKIMTMHASKGLEFPVVIIADICRTFKGADYSEMPFDEVYGFAPKYYDRENMISDKTVLRRFCKFKADGEELKNELNLFYVACTRAMCRLHILAEEIKPFSEFAVNDAKCYADTFDISKFGYSEIIPHSQITDTAKQETVVSKADKDLTRRMQKLFMAEYSYSASVDLPVKSSASAILRMRDESPYFAVNELFGSEGETGIERGVAYHRFLELCDFSKNSQSEIAAQANNFLNSGKILKEQFELLDFSELCEILQMSVFKEVKGAELFREREFLCRLPANEVLPYVTADDGILLQGAIDLLALGDFGVKIIDYKYSKKSDEQLIESYAPQLALYKKAVALITGVSEEKISCAIINLFRRRQIIL